MSTIYEPNDTFLFDKLKISKPVSILGGNYFIRFSLDNNPLYIQPPKCKTKQGFLKASKRFYTDLVFTNENDEFIRWMENLENFCHKHLFENRDKWFESDMELHDIENYFTSPLKIYKTGKFYLARVNIPTNLGIPNLTIYNENNDEVPFEEINEKTDVITILELKGIKCTTTSFQIEMEMKQMLTVKPVELFKKCIIKRPNQSIPVPVPVPVAASNEEINEVVPENDVEITEDVIVETDQDDEPIQENSEEQSSINKTDDENLVKIEVDEELIVNTDEELIINTDEDVVVNNMDDKPIDELEVKDEIVEENISTIPNQNPELEEVEIHLDESPDESIINIKNSNDVYYEMYREACRKAKIARDLALSSYLEAKRIKNTYMLEDITDSDDSDLEQENISNE